MYSKVIIFAMVFAAFAAADNMDTYSYETPDAPAASEESSMDDSYESGEAKYNFNWAVSDESSENHYGHQEARDGDDTQGSYYVQLPDGRLQRVSYHVDGDDGYVAEVTYEGEAQFPDSYESYEASKESAESSPGPIHVDSEYSESE